MSSFLARRRIVPSVSAITCREAGSYNLQVTYWNTMVRTKADSSCVKGKYTTMGFYIAFGPFHLQSWLKGLCDLNDLKPITTFTVVESVFLF